MRRVINSAPMLCLTLAALAAPALAQQKAKAPAAKPAPNTVKGQGQLVGGSAQFGTVYSLQNGFNFEILSARYTLEPFVAYETQIAGTDQKLLVADIAIKNTEKGDNFWNMDSLFTLVDDKGELYPGGALALQSKAADSASATLRPGQGLGQPALNDPLRVAWVVPAKARIVKIMVNRGRAGQNEQVVRYFVAGATKAEAGEEGNPKNVIAPLPAEAAADKTGAVAAEVGKGTAGTYLPSGYFGLRLDSFAFTTEALGGNAPDEGKKYAVATVTVKNLTEKTLSMFDVEGGDSPLYELTDSEGERAKPVAYRKAKRDEDAEHEFKKGDEYTFRVVFVVPKDVTAKTLVLGTGGARKWSYDVSATK
jgi:hypothetical protein